MYELSVLCRNAPALYRRSVLETGRDGTPAAGRDRAGRTELAVTRDPNMRSHAAAELPSVLKWRRAARTVRVITPAYCKRAPRSAVAARLMENYDTAGTHSAPRRSDNAYRAENTTGRKRLSDTATSCLLRTHVIEEAVSIVCSVYTKDSCHPASAKCLALPWAS